MPIEAPTAPETTMPTPSAPAFADFDATFPDGLDDPTPAPSSPPASEPVLPSGDAPTGAGAPTPKTDKAPEKPVEQKAPDETPDEYTPPQVAKPNELRGWALRMGKEKKAAVKELEEVKARLRQLESQPPRQQADNSALAQQLQAANQRIEQYEHDLRLTKYERSGEYRDKYEKPDNPKERAATQSDFDEVYSLPLGQATKLAKQKFGDASGIVLQHLEKIRDHMESAFAAVEQYKNQGSEQEKMTQAQAAQREAGMAQMFTQATQSYAKKFSEMVSPRDGDTEGNDLLTKGQQFASFVFAGNENLNPVDVVRRDARAYSWLSAYPRLARDVKSLKTQLSEAQKTIESLKSSGPGKPKPSSETAPSPAKTWESAFDEAVK